MASVLKGESVNPLLVIPTFWSRRRATAPDDPIAVYDHPSTLEDEGTLARCLDSLRFVDGVGRILVTVAADASIEHRADDKVREIAGRFPELDVFVFGSAELGSLHRRMEQLDLGDAIEGVDLKGYGSVRNVSLAVAAILGHDFVVFLDDDVVIDDPEFMHRAAEGFGQVVAEDAAPVLAKTGYYTDATGAWAPKVEKRWYDRWWRQSEAFNRWMRVALDGPRITRSNVATGGCLALHREAFKRVPFDPWITRGEDLDYVISIRMLGLDVWFDDKWSLRHLPPAIRDEAFKFRQDIYRWIYEHRKIEYGRSQVDLRQVNPRSLDPYPGPFLDASIMWRTAVTAFMRSLGRPERLGYFRAGMAALAEAAEYSRRNCGRYFAFARSWTSVIDALWEDVALNTLFTGQRTLDRTAMTGRFPAIEAPDQGETLFPVD